MSFVLWVIAGCGILALLLVVIAIIMVSREKKHDE